MNEERLDPEELREVSPVDEALYEACQKQVQAQVEAETMSLEELQDRAFKLICRCLVRIEQKLTEMKDRHGENETLGRAMAIASQIRRGVKASDQADPGAHSELQRAAEERIADVEIDFGDRGGGAGEAKQ